MTSSPALERLSAWSRARGPARPFARFRMAFAGVWLLYDICDVFLGGTAGCAWLEAPPQWSLALRCLQLGLIISEGGLLWGRGARLWAGAAFVLRGLEAWWFYRLNDFLYFCVTALVLTQGSWVEEGSGPAEATVPAWPRDVLLWQTAWIYFATALLKMNPSWLSGGHLYVRHQYLAAIGWPYPGFWRELVAGLGTNAWLARLSLVAEFSLAALLGLGGPGWLTLALAAAVHGYAALALNVWFFGASMVAQVAFVARDGKP